jgi:hypothetical protein
MDAQRPHRRARHGQTETIAERRVLALELRKAGGSYREIARQLGVDVHTAHGDVSAELAGLRETAVEHAGQLRALELQRLDEMTAGLWSQIQDGSPPAVSAAIRVSERRSRLLGLDEPVATKSEIIGSLTNNAERDRRLRAECAELQRLLTLEELEDLANASNALFEKAYALARGRGSQLALGVDQLRPKPLLLSAPATRLNNQEPDANAVAHQDTVAPADPTTSLEAAHDELREGLEPHLADSRALVAKSMATTDANALETRMLADDSPSPATADDNVTTGEADAVADDSCNE